MVIISLHANSQNKVCENSANPLIDINTLGKCAIEKFKKSNTTKTLQVSTRNRYVRKENKSRLTNFRSSLSTVSKLKKTKSIIKKNTVASALKVTTASITNVGHNIASEKTIMDFVRYDKVTKRPILLNCTNSADRHEGKCKQERLTKYLTDHLIYPFDAAADDIEGRVWVRFIVDKEGVVRNVSTSGPADGTLLKKEVERLMKLLPQFVPGRHNNDYVNVEYFIPVDFELDK